MPVYRVLKPLSKKHEQITPRGAIVNINWLDDDQLARLVEVGAIGKIKAPPLGKFPGWSRRHARLQKIGIGSVEMFLGADDEWLAERLNIKPGTARRWKNELIDRYLIVPEALKR